MYHIYTEKCSIIVWKNVALQISLFSKYNWFIHCHHRYRSFILKLIHCADLHLDSKMESNLSTEQANTRKTELLQTFERMITYANENDIHQILIAGDLFDTSNSHKTQIKKQIGYDISQNKQIDFYYLRGNHDKNDFFATLDDTYSNLKTFNDSWTSYKCNNVVITGIELPQKFSDTVYSSLSLSPNDINIVMLHGQIARTPGKEDAPLIDLRKLENCNINYLALGHIHSFQQDKLGKGVWCYSGCLEGRGFDECGDKGFVVIDIDDNKFQTKFVPFAKRKIWNVPVKLSGTMSYEQIMNSIKKETDAIPSDDLVKVTLTGEITEDTDINVDAYLQQFASQFFFIKIYDETTIAIDYEKYRKDISLKGEFVRHVEEQTDISQEEKSKIIITGLRALANEEINL